MYALQEGGIMLFKITIKRLTNYDPRYTNYISYQGKDLQSLYAEAKERLLNEGWLGAESIDPEVVEFSMTIEKIPDPEIALKRN
jgi:hypothetical protein